MLRHPRRRTTGKNTESVGSLARRAVAVSAVAFLTLGLAACSNSTAPQSDAPSTASASAPARAPASPQPQYKLNDLTGEQIDQKLAGISVGEYPLHVDQDSASLTESIKSETDSGQSYYLRDVSVDPDNCAPDTERWLDIDFTNTITLAAAAATEDNSIIVSVFRFDNGGLDKAAKKYEDVSKQCPTKTVNKPGTPPTKVSTKVTDVDLPGTEPAFGVEKTVEGTFSGQNEKAVHAVVGNAFVTVSSGSDNATIDGLTEVAEQVLKNFQ
ncbi:hypothetical protein QS713_01530 [Gleimia hominis]|uniref:Sensor domain-containing protein n=1 Tax=Gleimia hominis TaxID=595468 RepID=A0ABU3I8Q8_9ACTO|nr:hypothetical protein [Gleimia hominis]MDT3766748.1 hypothetical protein [Gleimia hominis]